MATRQSDLHNVGFGLRRQTRTSDGRRRLHVVPRISRQPLVLIADDDAATRAALCELLGEAGYRVRAAADGDGVVALACAETPDAVLLDLAMPGTDGVRAAELLRALDQMKNTAIIATTSSWLGDRLDLLEPAGFTAALRKPFRVERVLQLLEQYISRQGAVAG